MFVCNIRIDNVLSNHNKCDLNYICIRSIESSLLIYLCRLTYEAISKYHTIYNVFWKCRNKLQFEEEVYLVPIFIGRWLFKHLSSMTNYFSFSYRLLLFLYGCHSTDNGTCHSKKRMTNFSSYFVSQRGANFYQFS